MNSNREEMARSTDLDQEMLIGKWIPSWSSWSKQHSQVAGQQTAAGIEMTRAQILWIEVGRYCI